MRSLVILAFTILLSGCNSFWDLVVTGDERRLLRQSAKEAAACQVSRYLQAPMLHKNLYRKHQGSCVAVPLRDEFWFQSGEVSPQQTFYSDIFCKQKLDYQLTRYHQFCLQYAMPQRLGNTSVDNPHSWTLNPASRFRFPLLKQYGFDQPFMNTQIYSRIEVMDQTTISPLQEQLKIRRASGYCELQMRVYKTNPAAKGNRPLLVFHGGGGHQRGSHALALESRIPEFTEQGFTVYMPFYRLIGEGKANPECSQASWQNQKQDAEAALRWIQLNKGYYGDSGERVHLLAQGSGALLGGWLLSHHSEQLDRSVMFYPLLDSRLARAQIIAQGGYEDGRATLERVLGKPLEQVADDDPVLTETSLLTQLQIHKVTLPPVRILHGQKDKRIPIAQSEQFCQELTGNQSGQKNINVMDCQQAQLYRFSGAEYQLDYCFAGVDCPAGDEQSREQIAKALQATNLWLKGELAE